MIVSSIKGRIRLVDDNIKNLETADKIKKALKDLEGLESIRVNEVIGSLLLNYDQDKITEIQILEILKEYIDIRQKPKENPSGDNIYIDKAVDVVKKNLNRKKYSWGGSNQGSGIRADNFTLGGAKEPLKMILFSILGIEGYKKGKGLMQGQGKGKKG